MATSNARIQFSTADEKTWKDINPMLREGELVITKKPSGKYRLYVGGTGGSKFNDSILVWDEEEAENLANKAASNANLAEDHATSAGMSANAAMSSKSAAAASASYAAQSKEAAKASADTAKQSMETAKTNAINAAQSSALALQSSNEAKQSMNTAKENADTAKTAAANAINSASSAAESESKANVSKNAAEKSASAAKTSETNARSSEQAAAASAATVSYATQEEVNAGIENRKIVSPATLAPLVQIIQRKTAYKVGDCLHIPGRNDVYLECITAGTTATTVPDDLLTISGGVTVRDGTVKWGVKTRVVVEPLCLESVTTTSLGYVTATVGRISGEIIGRTKDGHRRVKFIVMGVVKERGVNSTEFKWLNIHDGLTGATAPYVKKYPNSKLVSVENNIVPFLYCNCLEETKKGYGVYAEISETGIGIGRIYTTNMDMGLYPNGELCEGGFAFSFVANFTND